ncbi:hypothetical protein Efla_004678 [Eimeria flavescens]
MTAQSAADPSRQQQQLVLLVQQQQQQQHRLLREAASPLPAATHTPAAAATAAAAAGERQATGLNAGAAQLILVVSLLLAAERPAASLLPLLRGPPLRPRACVHARIQLGAFSVIPFKQKESAKTKPILPASFSGHPNCSMAEEPLLDRAGVYTQLQQLLTPGSSNSVLHLLPPDTRAIWQSLGAAAAAAAAKHARAGDTPEVQQEMALQRMQQLLEAAAAGQQVQLEAAADGPLLLNRLLPQILAHRPFVEEKDMQEEKRLLWGSPATATMDGSRCTNKEQVVVALLRDEPENTESAAAAAAGGTDAAAAAAAASGAKSEWDCPSSMADDARMHWRWHQRRVQQLRGRMRRRAWGFQAAERTEPADTPEEEGAQQEELQATTGEAVLVGKLSGEGGRSLSWPTAILEPLDGSAPVQLLQLQETLQQQQQQLRIWNASKLQQQCDAPDALLFPGLVVAAKGRLRQDGYGQQQLLVSHVWCGLPVPRPLQPSTLEIGPQMLLLDSLHAAGRRPSAAAAAAQQQQLELGCLYRSQNVHVFFASCSFLEPAANGGWMLRRNALNGLLAAIREQLPHLVVLFGPIVSWMNLQQPAAASSSSGSSGSSGSEAAAAAAAAASLRCASLLQLPDFRLAYAEFFRRLAAAVQGLRTRVLLLPSSRDPLHAEPLPQPACSWAAADKGMQQQQQQSLPANIHCVSNPCTIQVNETRLLLCSNDPLADIAADLLCSSSSSSSSASGREGAGQPATQEDCMQQVFRALLRQRTLFPRGASPRVPLDAARMKPLLFDSSDAPHVVVCPSAGLLHRQTPTSGNSTSGSSEGAFACAADGRVFVSPFNPTQKLGDAFDFTCLYISPPHAADLPMAAAAAASAAAAPPPAAAAAAGSMQLPERVTIKYCLCRPRPQTLKLHSMLS